MRLRHIAIALALLAAFASDSWGQSQEPPAQSQPAAQPATPDKRGTDDVPLAIKIIPAPDAKEQADKAEHERKEKAVIDEKLAFETQRIADYTDRLALFTVLLFSVAVLQAGLFLWQLRYMRQGMRDAEMAAKAAQDSAEATKESVALARETNEINRQNFIADRRPWVDVGQSALLGSTIDLIGGDVVGLNFAFHMTNIGRAPATNLSVLSVLTFQNSDYAAVQREVSGWALGGMRGKDGIILFPNNPYQSGWAAHAPLDKLNASESPESRIVPLVVVGCLTYDFGSEQRNLQTTFLYQIYHPDFPNGIPIDSLPIDGTKARLVRIPFASIVT